MTGLRSFLGVGSAARWSTGTFLTAPREKTFPPFCKEGGTLKEHDEKDRRKKRPQGTEIT